MELFKSRRATFTTGTTGTFAESSGALPPLPQPAPIPTIRRSDSNRKVFALFMDSPGKSSRLHLNANCASRLLFLDCLAQFVEREPRGTRQGNQLLFFTENATR